MNLDYEILHSALSRSEKATEAWERWLSTGSLDQMPGASYRLMPLVHSNLVRAGYEGEELERIKGIRRKLWVEGEQRVYTALPHLRDLSTRFGKLILLKGVPLATLYYKDFGLRPMSDIDVLVEENAAIDLVRYLMLNGWTIVLQTHPRRINQEFLTYCHGAGFKHPSGIEIDVHWRLCYFGSRPGIDDIIRNSTEAFDLRGFSCSTLCPTDHLFHTMIHGASYNPFPASRWVADAVWLMKQERGIDFERLEQLGRHYNVGPYLESACQLLRNEFQVQMPELRFEAPGFWLGQELRRETNEWYSTPMSCMIAATLHRYSRTGASFFNLPRLLRYCQYQFDMTSREGIRAKFRRFRSRFATIS